jgi:hypothetical protein
MSEIRVTRADIPWSKFYDENNPLPLPTGVSAMIPNPNMEGGFLHLSPQQYESIVRGISQSVSRLDENMQKLREKAYQDAAPPSRAAMHELGDAIYIQSETAREMNGQGEQL